MPLLSDIECEIDITEGAAPEFLYQTKNGLLLAMLELGSLNQLQYEKAAALLRNRHSKNSGKERSKQQG